MSISFKDHDTVRFAIKNEGLITMTLHYNADAWAEMVAQKRLKEIDRLILELQVEEFYKDDFIYDDIVLPSPIGDVAYVTLTANMCRLSDLEEGDNVKLFAQKLIASPLSIPRAEINELILKVKGMISKSGTGGLASTLAASSSAGASSFGALKARNFLK